MPGSTDPVGLFFNFQMLLIFDAEFTDLDRPVLISIGLASEDGKHVFYGEITRGLGWDNCSDFVTREVLPLLLGGQFTMSIEDLKNRLLTWLAGIPFDCTLACDSEIDMDLVRGLLGETWPARLNQKRYDLKPMMTTPEFGRAMIRCHQERGGKEHHALDDAWANRAGWISWRKAKQRPA